MDFTQNKQRVSSQLQRLGMAPAASLGIRKDVPPVTACVTAGTVLLYEGNALPWLEPQKLLGF